MKALLAAILASFIVNVGCYSPVTNHVVYTEQDGEDLELGELEYDWYPPQVQNQIKTELNVEIPAEKPPLAMPPEERKEVILDLKTTLNDRVETAKKVDKTTQTMLKLAVFTLKRKGFDQKAQEIEDTYRQYYRNAAYYYAIGAVQDIGDHPPMWEWLDKVEKELRALLGDFIMEVTRLSDLRTVNYALPIVLHPAGDIRTDPPTVITKPDYKDHFVPFSGVIAYWSAWGACTGATWGAGAVIFICSPIGMISERIVEKKIAPNLSDKIWERYN